MKRRVAIKEEIKRAAINEISDKTIVVDFNHPLAGKTLNFDVKLTDIKAAETR